MARGVKYSEELSTIASHLSTISAQLEIETTKKTVTKLGARLLDKVILDVGSTGAWDSMFVSDPCLIKKGNEWYMYYFGYDGSHARVGLAISNDGESFEKYEGNPILDVGASGEWDSLHAHKPHVIFNPIDGKYYMFYSGDNGTERRIGLAISDDGINFTKYAGNPILEDPEGTGYLDAPSVFYYPKDGKWYMFAYNRNGYNLIFSSTNLINWTLVGKLSSTEFGIYSVDAIYDENLDKILVFANIVYPKQTGVAEPTGTARIGLFVADKPTGPFMYAGVLIEVPGRTRDDILDKMVNNVFAPGVIKIGNRTYALYFNAKASDSRERIFMAYVGENYKLEYQITGVVWSITTDPSFTVIQKLAPGTKARIKSFSLYAWAGTPTELYLYRKTPDGADAVIQWTNTKLLQFTGDVPVGGRADLGIAVRGASSTNVISVAYSLILEFEPLQI